YPIQCVRLSRDESVPTILVFGGTHGDEPAGVEAALAFIETGHAPWLDRLRFEVVPCLNPWGYVHESRHNRQDIDLNWAFDRENLPEIAAVRALVAGRRFEAFIDLHEDWESPGYYLYELRRDGEPVGPEITRRAAKVCPIDTRPEIEGMEALNGVILPPDTRAADRRGAGIPIALFQRHTSHLVTSETPSSLALEPRVRAHEIALETIIAAHSAQ
ncbi:M14 family metallocarboxypeptidase, partial [Candidatus Poribacteria bacterium]|nr:M14 family metallocarboxypeptidase [Candidatus Poribacteria bacterium]